MIHPDFISTIIAHYFGNINRPSAYTLTHLETRYPVQDAAYVVANNAAKSIFDRDLGSEHELWQSFTLPREVRRLCATLGRARAMQIAAGVVGPIEDTYRSPIIRGDGSVVDVVKHVQAFVVQDERYYLTHIIPVTEYPTEPPHILDVTPPDEIDGDFDRQHAFMADIRDCLSILNYHYQTPDGNGFAPTNFVNLALTDYATHNTISESVNTMANFEMIIDISRYFDKNSTEDADILQKMTIGTGLGDSMPRHMPDGTVVWTHQCKRCGHVRRGQIKWPYTCTNRECQTTYWYRKAHDPGDTRGRASN